MSLTRKKPTEDALAIGIEVPKNWEIGDDVKQYIYVDENDELEGEPVVRLEVTEGNKFVSIPFIPKDQRSAFFISGVSGSGKSTSGAMTVKLVRSIKEFKKYKTYLITLKKEKDPAFAKLKNFWPLDLTDRDTLAELEDTEFENCIVIFDDWERADRDLLVWIFDLQRKLLELSRNRRVIPIVMTHVTQQGYLTKGIIFECDTYIMYHRNNFNACKRFLLAYLDVTKEMIEEIKTMKGRFITVRKSFPTHLLSEKLILKL